LKVGEGNGRFIADLAEGVSDAELRRRYRNGDYGKLRPDYVTGWRIMAGRKQEVK
jgi:hypothetical protein